MTRKSASLTSESFEPQSAEFADNPYGAYRSLREADELIFYAPYQTYLVARFADVNRLVRDRTLVRTLDDFYTPQQIAEQKRKDNWHDMPFHSKFVQFSMLDSDGAVHDRLRKQVFSFFGPAPVARLRDTLTPRISAWVDEALELGSFDFVEQLAARVPGFSIGTIMGVPLEDCEQIRLWSEQIVAYFDIDRSDAKKMLAEAATQEFYEYLLKLTDERRQSPREDLLTQLIEVESAGLISHEEFYSTCMLIVMAGHGSTLDVMGTGMLALIKFPEQQEHLREKPELMRSAIPEMFRFESPLPFFHRYASEALKIGGQNFERGTRFGLLYGAANRDPAAFERPDNFDVSRRPNRHLAFGGGAHFCLGNHLARLSMEILFAELLAKTKTIALACPPVFKPGLSARGLRSLIVTTT